MRWDQSPECRAAIEQGIRSEQEHKAHRAKFKEQDILLNEIWHDGNLDMLAQCVVYARSKEHYHEFMMLLLRFNTEEYNRLEERIRIMQLYGIEVLPHRHKAREKALYGELKILLGGKSEQGTAPTD